MIVVTTKRGIARADIHRVRGLAVAYVVRWEVIVGGVEHPDRIEGGMLVGDSRTYPIHGDGAEARGFAWRALCDAAEGNPPRSVLRTSWPVAVIESNWRAA